MKFNRLPLLFFGIFSLLAGMWGGLQRIGWELPTLSPELITLHGPLMLCGFLGTVISLERAVAVDKHWAYLAPVFSGLGAFSLIFGLPLISGKILILTGSVILLVIYIKAFKQQTTLFEFIMLLGTLCWITGNFLWLFSFPLTSFVFWWFAFILLTITGERLELARLGNISKMGKNTFILSTVIFILGLILTIIFTDIGIRLTGIGFLAYTAWLSKNDIAKYTIKTKGLTKYIAACLLSSYFWLGSCGIMLVLYGSSFSEGMIYGAILHSFFLGFAFSMIFGHAPIIFPAILKISITYHPRFYIHLVLLHLSLMLRVVSYITGYYPGIKTGAMLNVLTIIFFVLNTVISFKMLNISDIRIKKNS